MTPTHEQLEAVARAICADDGSFEDKPEGVDACWPNHKGQARVVWDIIAPMVLEAAAKAAEEPTEQRYPLDVRRVVAERIRALK